MSITNRPFKVNMNYLNDKIHEDVYTIDELLKEVVPFSLVDKEIIRAMYLLELESLLTITDVNKLARSIVLEMPDLSTFYLSLSPVFLQTLCEEGDNEEPESLKGQWLKAFRIAIEEEVSSWQEK